MNLAPTTSGATDAPWPVPETALVLGGGIFRNAFQVGALEALHRRGFRPQLVIGVSSGAWNGACLVAGQIDQMRRFWEVVARLPKVSLRNAAVNRTLFNIRSIIREIPEAELDFGAIARSRTRFLVGATQLSNLRFRLLELNSRPGVEVFAGLMASNLIPGVVGWPVRFSEKRYIDGGFTNRVPYAAALDAGARQVIVVVPDGEMIHRPRPGSRRQQPPEPRHLDAPTIVAPRRRLAKPGGGPRHIADAIDEGLAVGLEVPL
ncbi:MAG: patatin-like phospholipase family protein [Acidimicrobiales bacterium]